MKSLGTIKPENLEMSWDVSLLDTKPSDLDIGLVKVYISLKIKLLEFSHCAFRILHKSIHEYSLLRFILIKNIYDILCYVYIFFCKESCSVCS